MQKGSELLAKEEELRKVNDSFSQIKSVSNLVTIPGIDINYRISPCPLLKRCSNVKYVWTYWTNHMCMCFVMRYRRESINPSH